MVLTGRLVSKLWLHLVNTEPTTKDEWIATTAFHCLMRHRYGSAFDTSIKKVNTAVKRECDRMIAEEAATEEATVTIEPSRRSTRNRPVEVTPMATGDRRSKRKSTSGDDRPLDEHRRRERKQKETRRLVRPPPLTSTVTSPFALGVSVTSSVTGGGGGGGGAPEQTEPEDLSVRRPAASDEDMPDELPRRLADSLPLSADSSRDAFSETAGTLART